MNFIFLDAILFNNYNYMQLKTKNKNNANVAHSTIQTIYDKGKIPIKFNI